ncbi:hypothetical protein [Terrisporobacter petrolearius]
MAKAIFMSKNTTSSYMVKVLECFDYNAMETDYVKKLPRGR